MTDTTTWTIGRLLAWTADYLQQHGAESPRLDAEVLLAHARDCGRIDLYTAYEEPADELLRTKFRELVRQRAAGKPVAYLVGYREFYSLRFEVTEDVLIPRPESEHLVLTTLEEIKKRTQVAKTWQILDVGTGSGCLAVTLATHLPATQITAIDICPKALQVARRNSQLHQVSDRVQLLESDLLTALDPQQRFDYIVSNPPYIASSEQTHMDTDVLRHEPPQALFAGEDGLDVIRRLLPQAAAALQSDGVLLMEINSLRAQATRRLAESLGVFASIEVLPDTARQPRVLVARKIN